VDPDDVERKLAAILSADVVGYARLMAEDEAATIRTLTDYREEIARLVRQHRGRVVDSPGDNVLADFPTALEAVRAAVEIQRVIGVRNAELPSGRRMEFRIGVHLGDVAVEGERIYGDGVNIAARLESLAEPGGICLSGTIHDQVQRKLDLSYEDLGKQNLKNLPDPVQAYRIRLEPEAGLPSQSLPGMDELTVPGFSGVPAIAVLPFDNLSGDPEQEYFADGIGEDLITRLSAWRYFPVISRNSSFVYKGKSVDVKQVSRELGVRFVVEGSVRKFRDRVRISAQLIDATTGAHVWAEKYDRELTDIFAVQDEITETIVGSLVSASHRIERRRSARRDPQDLDVWESVQRGYWHLYPYTKDETLKAESLFRDAIERDPHFSIAHVALSQCLAYQIIYRWADSPAKTRVECLRVAEESVALGEDLPAAHVCLGMACQVLGDYERALTAHQKAIELNPSYALAHWGLSLALTYTGRPDEAMEALRKALRLSPHDELAHFFLRHLALLHFIAERYQDAVEWAKRSLDLSPRQADCLRILAASYGNLGRSDEARAALDTALGLEPGISMIRLRSGVPRPYAERYLDGLRKAGLRE
jgi:adenylate cyclase